jgi:hypothetical protein
MSILGFALPAFLVSAAKDGKEGVRNGTGRSVLIVALFHSSFNSVTGSGYATRFIRELIAGPAALLICLAVLSVVAVLITLLTRGRLAYRLDGTARPTLPYAGTRQGGGAA